MKTSKWNVLKRSLASGLVALVAMLGFVIPAQATQAPVDAPQVSVSSWSINVLNEGEKYGIFPLTWYTDGTFQQPISADKFQALMKATSAKLDALELKKKNTFTVPATEKVITRESVINAVYGVLTQYDLPESIQIGTDEPIAFLQKKGIVNGTGKGLDLDKPSTVEQAVVMASRLVEYTYDAVDGGAKGLLWKATKGQNTLYLLGSIHVGSPEMYPIKKSVRDAFKQADSLWVEVDLLGNKDMDYFTQSMAYTDGTTLKDHVSKETYAKLQKVLEKMQLPKEVFDGFKPWAITTNLALAGMTGSQEEMAQAAALGIDSYFTNSALLAGKPIHELEGLKLQADIFNKVPVATQEKELNEALDQVLTPTGKPDESMELLQSWQKLWVKADLDKFKQSFTSSKEKMTTDSAKRLLGERDKNMAKKLMELLDKEGSSTHFVVVGAAHYVVQDMVVDQLKAKGYQVEFVK
ncbi:TraB/GumN family protein [Paenibacillus alvei]|uniref:TraB/GumN family protein n=1 Tax=Paenibacillus alvei TaxID=44250 RepID=A0ABT4GUH0_PAEAL|nr:TraB/GumN family protein [Paenibacillus alvei]MCY9544208.1 TraB/GumN family protein [Paenibacillus alvei]MCY9708102.1 TraB/GumN family protein [Paenibacillus alvei]MCY9737397.1 TraB/GumN family protein [Paenibacillus alvei]MCY9757911.1 TraB/GumN family protein [Paenibacillus alvei]MCY9760101.1 TraB/GumN family protein [Paenibacillus alvei]